MIEPTVGRIVLYHTPQSKAPMAAMIAAVNESGTLNIMYADHCGSPCGRMSVKLVQPGEKAPDSEYCTWMDYQVGQAATRKGKKGAK